MSWLCEGLIIKFLLFSLFVNNHYVLKHFILSIIIYHHTISF